MSSRVYIRDFSAQVSSAIREHALIALETAANEMASQVKRRTRESTFWPKDVRGSWDYAIDLDKIQATVGSPLEQSYWEELGTGEYAVNKDGRKGWWVYVEGNDQPTRSFEVLSRDEAEQRAAYLRDMGLDAHISNGTPPNRPMHRAFVEEKDTIIAVIESEMERLEGERNV